MALRKKGIDVVSVHELGRTGLPDVEQLAFAVQEERAILTHNIADFMALALAYHQQQQTHFGILVAPHLEKGTLVRRTLALLEKVTQAELMNTVRYI
jgi:predicted nuclease of predicted toxin-antitoxin system